MLATGINNANFKQHNLKNRIPRQPKNKSPTNPKPKSRKLPAQKPPTPSTTKPQQTTAIQTQTETTKSIITVSQKRSHPEVPNQARKCNPKINPTKPQNAPLSTNLTTAKPATEDTRNYQNHQKQHSRQTHTTPTRNPKIELQQSRHENTPQEIQTTAIISNQTYTTKQQSRHHLNPPTSSSHINKDRNHNNTINKTTATN